MDVAGQPMLAARAEGNRGARVGTRFGVSDIQEAGIDLLQRIERCNNAASRTRIYRVFLAIEGLLAMGLL